MPFAAIIFRQGALLGKAEDAESEIMMNRYWRERTYLPPLKNPRIRSNHWLDEPLTK